MRWWKVVLVLVGIGGVVALLAYGLTTDPRAIPSTLTGKPAPDFSLTLFDGRSVRLSDYRGKVVFLNFWASWCPPCRAEIPDFVDLYKKYHAKGLEIIGLSVDQSAEPVVDFVKEFAVNYPIVMAAPDVIKAYGDIKGIPTSFILDAKGNILARYVGFRPRDVFEKDIRTALKIKG